MTKNNKKIDLKGLLKKKTSELTSEEKGKLEKPLGTSKRPFPMWGTVSVEYDGRRELQQMLTMIADDTNPLKVVSERNYDEVIGLAYREMPVPSMLPIFFDGLERRKLSHKGKVQFVKGDPGAGKSFMGAMLGRMRSAGSVDVLDCGGKNMRELLFEMVLDFGGGDALPQAIDKRIQAGKLESISMGLLKSLGEIEKGAHVKELKNDKIEIDWDGLAKSGTKNVEKVYETLKKVSEIEGLDKQGGNALGMNSQFGPAITSFINGTELVLDEYNKSKEGTDDNLQTFLQFATGEIDECVVENPLKNKDASSGPSEFVFRREDIKAGWFLTLTGNAVEDGITTRQLNKSVYSRLSPQTIPDPTPADWQHRICQIMTGLPVSTLYNVFQEQADANPEKFTEALLYWRTAGLSQDEIDNIPEIQMTFIKNWKNVIPATEKLAEFYNTWQLMTDVDKCVDFGAELAMEVDETFSHEVSIDFRKVIQHIGDAMPMKPAMQPVVKGNDFDLGSWGDDVPELQPEENEDTALNYGTRLTDLLIRHVFESSGAIGKPQLYQKLLQEIDRIGLKDMDFQEAARSSEKSVEDLLNISVFNDKDPQVQAELVQGILCDYLRASHEELKEAKNEDIVTKTMIVKLLADYRDWDTKEIEGKIVMPNTDLEELADGKPFDTYNIVDTCVDPEWAEENLYVDDIADHDRYLSSLVMPVVGKRNVEASFDKNLIKFFEESNGAKAPAGQDENDIANDNDNGNVSNNTTSFNTPNYSGPDEAMKIAQNASDTGLATTTVVVAKHSKNDAEDPELVPVHIIRNSKRDKTLVVADELSPRLEAMFKQAGVIYVNRSAPGAVAKIDAGLKEVTRGMAPTFQEQLRTAVKYRYDNSKFDKMSLSQVMTSKAVPGLDGSEADNDDAKAINPKLVLTPPKAM